MKKVCVNQDNDNEVILFMKEVQITNNTSTVSNPNYTFREIR